MAWETHVGGQHGWHHEEGHDCGFFHTFDRFQLDGDDRPRKIHVFLPLQTAHEPRPVIFFHDGQDVFFPHDGNNSLKFADALSTFVSSRPVVQPVLVAICAGEDRDHEYTHLEFVEGVGGGLIHYSKWVSSVSRASLAFLSTQTYRIELEAQALDRRKLQYFQRSQQQCYLGYITWWTCFFLHGDPVSTGFRSLYLYVSLALGWNG